MCCDNKRERQRPMVKITLEVNGETRVIEAHGVALTTVLDNGDNYGTDIVVAGCMCIEDLCTLRDNVQEDLSEAVLASLAECIQENGTPALKRLLGCLGGK